MNENQYLKKMVEDMKLRNLSINTINAYLLDVRAFIAYCDMTPIESYDTDIFREYLKYLSSLGNLSISTINRKNASIRFFFEVTLDLPLRIKQVPLQKAPKSLPSVFSQEEVIRFFDTITNTKHYAMFSLAIGSGLRVNEITHLKVSDIDSKNMCVFIHSGKGDKDRYVNLSECSLKHLRTYWETYKPDRNGFLFPGVDNRKPISTEALDIAFHKYLVLSKIHKQATPHTLRHTFATMNLNAGVDIFKIQKLLGHASLHSTQRYIHVMNRDIIQTKSPLDIIMENRKHD